MFRQIHVAVARLKEGEHVDQGYTRWLRADWHVLAQHILHNDMRHISVQSQQFTTLIYYFWRITSRMWPPSVATRSLKRHIKLLKPRRKHHLIYGGSSIPNSMHHFLHCLWASHVCAFILLSSPIRRSPGTSDPAKVQAVEHPIHENISHRSLIFHIIHRSVVIK